MSESTQTPTPSGDRTGGTDATEITPEAATVTAPELGSIRRMVFDLAVAERTYYDEAAAVEQLMATLVPTQNVIAAQVLLLCPMNHCCCPNRLDQPAQCLSWQRELTPPPPMATHGHTVALFGRAAI